VNWLAIPGVIGLAALGLVALVLTAYHFGTTPRPQTVAGELANRDIARTIAWPVMLRYQTAHRSSESIGAELGAPTLILISIRDADREKLVSAFLMDAASGQKRRVTSYVLADVSSLAAQRSVAHKIVGDLAVFLGPR